MYYQFQQCSVFQITTVFMSSKEFQTTGNSEDEVQIYTWRYQEAESNLQLEKYEKNVPACIFNF